MHWVDENVAIGNWIDAREVSRLKTEGVEMLIDARTLFNQTLGAIGRRPDVRRVRRAGELLAGVAGMGAKVLVFCRHGKDRSPFVVMVYASERYGMGYREAYELVRRKHRETVYHWDWVEQLPRNTPR